MYFVKFVNFTPAHLATVVANVYSRLYLIYYRAFKQMHKRTALFLISIPLSLSLPLFFSLSLILSLSLPSLSLPLSLSLSLSLYLIRQTKCELLPVFNC
jgi:hypothetical protein